MNFNDLTNNNNNLNVPNTTLIDTTRNPYHDVDWATEFAKLDNKLDSMDMNINELIIYEIENYNDTIIKNK